MFSLRKENNDSYLLYGDDTENTKDGLGFEREELKKLAIALQSALNAGVESKFIRKDNRQCEVSLSKKKQGHIVVYGIDDSFVRLSRSETIELMSMISGLIGSVRKHSDGEFESSHERLARLSDLADLERDRKARLDSKLNEMHGRALGEIRSQREKSDDWLRRGLS